MKSQFELVFDYLFVLLPALQQELRLEEIRTMAKVKKAFLRTSERAVVREQSKSSENGNPIFFAIIPASVFLHSDLHYPFKEFVSPPPRTGRRFKRKPDESDKEFARKLQKKGMKVVKRRYNNRETLETTRQLSDESSLCCASGI